MHSNGRHEGAHVVSAVLKSIVWGGGKVSFLSPVLVGQVSACLRATGVPVRFSAVDGKVGLSHALAITNIVEKEELSFRSHPGVVANSRIPQAILHLSQDISGIASVRHVVLGSVNNIALEGNSRSLNEGVHNSTGGVRKDNHVRLVDWLPASDRRSVETKSRFKDTFVQLVDAEGNVLTGSEEITKMKVEKLGVVGFSKGNGTLRIARVFQESSAQKASGSDSSFHRSEHCQCTLCRRRRYFSISGPKDGF